MVAAGIISLYVPPVLCRVIPTILKAIINAQVDSEHLDIYVAHNSFITCSFKSVFLVRSSS
jgi:hypothetical protein